MPPRPRVRGVHRVGVAGKKDLYEYWKGDIAQCLVEDVRGKGSVESCTDEFLVVNVASQEVRSEAPGNSIRKVDLCIRVKYLHVVILNQMGLLRLELCGLGLPAGRATMGRGVVSRGLSTTQ